MTKTTAASRNEQPKAAPKRTTTRRAEAPKRETADLPEFTPPSWQRMFVAFAANIAAAAGIGAVFGIVADALVAAAITITGIAFVGTVLSFLMQLAAFALVLVAGVKIWDGVISGTIEKRAKEGWSDLKAWVAMRRELRGAAA